MPPIHRKNLYSLQYSMLPVQRVSIGELWQLLNSDWRDRDREKKGGEGLGASNGHVVNGFIGGGGGGKKGGLGVRKNEPYWWSR